MSKPNAHKSQVASPLGVLHPAGRLSASITGSATRNLNMSAQFTVSPGERLAIIGHNGSGKTSILRLIAGLDYATAGTTISSGDLTLVADGQHLAVPDRHVPMTFAEPRLFPHMTVLENLTFGVTKGRKKYGGPRVHRDSDGQAIAALESLGLAHLANRPAGTLSSGQSATIAVLRTVFASGRAVLLDEPFSALDTAIAGEVRATVRSYLENLFVPLLIATHNPLDVLSLATHVAVMEHGALTQIGTVEQVALQPRSDFAAQFLGLNLLRGVGETGAGGVTVSIARSTSRRLPNEHVLAEPPKLNQQLLVTAHIAELDLSPGQAVFAAFSPASVTLSLGEPHGSAQNTWQAEVASVEQMGSIMRVTIGATDPIRADITTAAAVQMGLQVGQSVWASIKATAIEVYPA